MASVVSYQGRHWHPPIFCIDRLKTFFFLNDLLLLLAVPPIFWPSTVLCELFASIKGFFCNVEAIFWAYKGRWKVWSVKENHRRQSLSKWNVKLWSTWTSDGFVCTRGPPITQFHLVWFSLLVQYLDEVITNVSCAIDAKYHQIALRLVLVHKPLNLGYVCIWTPWSNGNWCDLEGRFGYINLRSPSE